MPELVQAKTITLPSLGADMDVGTVVEWCVAVGDRVERGDVVAIVSTEKSDIDVEAWDSGVVSEFVAPIGEEIGVGEPLLILATDEPREAAELPPPHDGPEQPKQEGPRPATPPSPAVPSHTAQPRLHDRQPGDAARHRAIASPLARRIAAERDISLDDLRGSGPGGAIVAADLPAETASAGTDPVPATTERVAAPQTAETVNPMRRIIGERMTRSNHEIPHYYLEREIDMAAAMQWLADHNDGLPITERVVPAALLACAVSSAAKAVPQLNGTWIDGHFVASEGVDLAVAISLRSGGLVTPTVVGAEALDADQMMETMRDMVTRARKGQLRGRWMTAASITITNLGDNGADRVDGIIFPPQIALVGFGRISDRPWVVDGDVVARPIVTASLAADHRATDGADGSKFLAAVANALEHPATTGP